MPAVAQAPVAWRAFDDDADPLAGGALYAFAAGTDTPQSTYADPQGLTLNPHPVILDDAGYADVYLQAGKAYKLRLQDQFGTLQWEMDQVYGTGSGGGSAAAGLGWGQNTLRVVPASGVASVSLTLFPADVLGLAVTVWIEATLGTSQGLSAVGIGTPQQPDAYGYLTALTSDTSSRAGLFEHYSGQPQPTGGIITFTAYGGRFDGTGSLYATGHFATFSPSGQEGLTYSPPGTPGGGPVTPYAYATESAAGVVELIDSTEVLQDTDLTRALTIGRLLGRPSTETRLGLTRYGTDEETTTGTLRTVATHPAGVQAALDARVPAGAALSVPRYSSSGTQLEASPLTIDSSGNMGLRTPAPVAGLHMVGESHSATQSVQETYTGVSGYVSALLRKASGTQAAPERLTLTQGVAQLLTHGWVRDAADTADAWVELTRLRTDLDSLDAQGRAGGRLSVWVAPGVSAPPVEALRLTQGGNLLLGAQAHGTGLTKGLALGSGTPPTNSQADQVQMWSADTGGLAGQAGLHLRTENGTLHVLGNSSGIGTHCGATLGAGATYRSLNVTNAQLFVRQSSTQERAVALVEAPWVVATDATRTGRLALSVYDSVAAREGLRMEADGTAARIGFLGANAVVRQTVPAAATDPATTQTLANSLRTALVNLGLCV